MLKALRQQDSATVSLFIVIFKNFFAFLFNDMQYVGLCYYYWRYGLPWMRMMRLNTFTFDTHCTYIAHITINQTLPLLLAVTNLKNGYAK